jgi:hypothetical protein
MVKNMQLPFACNQLGCNQTAKLKIVLNPPNRGARIVGSKRARNHRPDNVELLCLRFHGINCALRINSHLNTIWNVGRGKIAWRSIVIF